MYTFPELVSYHGPTVRFEVRIRTMKTVAPRNTARTKARIIAILEPIDAATCHEARGYADVMTRYLRLIYPGTPVAGSAITMLTSYARMTLWIAMNNRSMYRTQTCQ